MRAYEAAIAGGIRFLQLRGWDVDHVKGGGFSFQLLREDAGKGRLGLITTPHGQFPTPAFMPVGSQGTVKALAPVDLQEIGAEIILCNAYHLYLRPGTEVIREAGGLHRFMGWSGPLLTDSGGFQIVSMSGLREIESEGVRFRSHLDGSLHFLTPEKVVEIQEGLGSDIMMVLDDCPPYPASFDEVKEAVALTTQWAKRSREAKGVPTGRPSSASSRGELPGTAPTERPGAHGDRI